MKHIIEVYLKKSTFKNLENAEKVAKNKGFKINFRNKKGIITEKEFIFKQKDKSRYTNREKIVVNDNFSYLVGFKFKK